MDKAKTRILKSIRLAIQLMDFTNLSDEQLQLNADVVNWLNKIKPIFEEYSDVSFHTLQAFVMFSAIMQFVCSF